MQPYHRGEKFAYHRLWMLRELSNADKHRVLHPTLLLPQAMGMFGDLGVSDITLSLGPVQNGIEVARYPYSGEADAKIDVNPYFTFGIGFRQGSPLPILPTDILNTMTSAAVLEWIHTNVVRQVALPLRQFLRRALLQ